MFWGLIMEPQKRYSQVIKKAFHISMACLDVSNSDDQPAQILCGYEGKNYLLCTLQKPDKLQCNLDLYFEEGHTVSFASNGKSHIHLTGYLTKDEEEIEDASDEEDAQEFEVQAKKHLRSKDNSVKEPVKKKIKLEEAIDEEEDSDDSDFNIEKYFEEAEAEESEDEEVEDMLSDEEGDLEDESMGEEEDGEEEDVDQEETEDEDDDAEKVEEIKEQVVQNGLSKKSKKNKKEEQQTTPTKKNKQNKEKQHELTPGPKKQDKANSVDQKSKSKEEKKSKESSLSVPKKRTLANGIIVEDLKVGQGDSAGAGKFIHVYYEGRLKNNNKLFDKTLSGPGFGFRLGKGEVIKGWDIGVAGMKVGGKRRIICPPQAGYGAKGSPPVIPPNSTLVFDVELRKIK
ncbi:46 kDa FK506-binding nuclear protein-like [Harmonia axyridis]|uniref:46 kDa FK506-binding nuclear protein-like n=1 Tax=Harmonia axyridis TaxID=115357 RepID=UPI001E278840|nr:46 kDa FK506-binding nuclear protein-like [Harmonia axyridis]